MSSGVSLGNGKATRQSPKALGVALDKGLGVTWIPKACLHDDSEVYEVGHEGNVVVLEWWADKEGFSDVGKRSKPL